MTVRCESGVAMLEGACGVEDAEALLTCLLSGGATAVDVSKATHLHAVVQVLLALAPAVAGVPADPFLRRFIVPALTGADDTSPSGTAASQDPGPGGASVPGGIPAGRGTERQPEALRGDR
jgi:hypothetical protein